MNRLLMGLALVATTHGFSEATQSKGLGGYYIGLGVGSSITSTRYHYEQGIFSAIQYSGSRTFAKVNASLFWGYSQALNESFFVGGELFVDGNFNSQKSLSTVNMNPIVGGYNPVTTTLRRKSVGVGAYARVGYMVRSTLGLYLGVGVKSTGWEFNVQDVVNGVDFKMRKRVYRPMFTGGLEGNFCASRLGYRLSYSFVPGTKHRKGPFPVNHFLAGPTSVSEFKANEQVVTAAAIVRFQV